MIYTKKYINNCIWVIISNQMLTLIHWLRHYWYTTVYHFLISTYYRSMDGRVYLNVKAGKKEVGDMKPHFGTKTNWCHVKEYWRTSWGQSTYIAQLLPYISLAYTIRKQIKFRKKECQNIYIIKQKIPYTSLSGYYITFDKRRVYIILKNTLVI